ncbi:MAG: putative maltokinase, partial [Betaproteobacteria bacterium]
QWAIFLRNHDELTLEMVTSKERDYMYNTYAADPRARINLGIRRRLAPLMENDIERIKLMNSLLLSMHGSPIIYYGDEIGMGDNVFVGDRNGVRTPMQWSPDRNAGFSRGDPQRLYLAPIMDAVYGYQAVNVESQMLDKSSLLNWMRRMLTVRQSTRTFGRGDQVFLKPGNRKILAYLRTHGSETMLCVANLARSAQPVELELSRYKGRVPVELLGRTTFPPIGELPYQLSISAYGFYWFRLAADADVPNWHQPASIADERPVLVLFDGFLSLFRDQVVPWRISMAVKTRSQFENDTLPRFIETQRWYSSKGTTIDRARIADSAIWTEGDRSWLLPLVELDGPAEAPAYFVPLAMAWEDSDDERMRALAPAAVARIRQQANVGVMGDAFADEAFCRALVAAIGANRELATEKGKLNFRPSLTYAQIAGDHLGEQPFTRRQAVTSNTLITFGERLFVKGYRRIREGINPEFEIGHHLTDVAHFPNCVPVAGALDYTRADGKVMTLALIQGFVPNQGDGWEFTSEYLRRHLDERRGSAAPIPPDVHGGYLQLAAVLGQRTAELHLAFALRTGNPAFEPEPLSAADLAILSKQVDAQAAVALDELQARRAGLPADALAEAEAVLRARPKVRQCIEEFAANLPPALKTRTHGDYHLGQVLLTRNDFVIVDFEGEPGRTFEERRRKSSPLRDVAGMLRSFSYARLNALRLAAQTDVELAELAPLAADWERQARSTFLQAYDARAQGSGLYGSLDPGKGMLGLFELEKALYELHYELANRPDWVRIPLQGILAILGTD